MQFDGQRAAFKTEQSQMPPQMRELKMEVSMLCQRLEQLAQVAQASGWSETYEQLLKALNALTSARYVGE